MCNQVILVGRLVQNPELQIICDKEVVNVDLAIQRNFKNSNGEYETDFIKCVLWSSVASSTCEYCQKGDVVGIKGRLQSHIYETKDGNKRYSLEVICERVSLISSSKPTS